jgi:hypothetical protein
MAYETLLQPTSKQALKMAGDNFFFKQVESNIVQANQDTLNNMKGFADMFPVKSAIRDDLAAILARAKKDPEFLKNGIKVAYGVEYV